MNPKSMEDTYEWYTSGPRQRLQPGGAIVIVDDSLGTSMTLTGKLLKDAARDPKQINGKLLELPAILPSGKPLWPEFWS